MNEVVKLGDHTTKIGSGKTPTGGHHSYQLNGIPLIRSQNVLMGCFSKEGLAHISEEIDASMYSSRVFANDVLLNITGASIGRVCVVPGEICPANVNQHVCIIRCDESLIPDYVAGILASPKFQTFIMDSQAGGTRQALTKLMIQGFDVPWCSIEKQLQIVARLKAQMAEVAKACQAAASQLSDASFLLTRYQKTAMEKLADAPRVPLGDLLMDIEAGKSFKTTDLPARVGELGILKVSAVSWNVFQPQEAKSIEGDYQPDEKHRVKKGDLIISRANTIDLVGAVVRVHEDYPLRLLSDKTLRLVVNSDRILPDYLLAILKWPEARAHIEKNATGTSDSMRNISQKTIRSIPIPLLSKDEQQTIINSSQAVNHELDRIRISAKQTLNDLSILPQKILAQAFDQ